MNDGADAVPAVQQRIFGRVVAALRWVAAEPSDALSLFGIADVAAVSVSGDFLDAYMQYRKLGAVSDASDVRAQLDALEDVFLHLPDADDTDAAFRASPTWQTQREAARAVLVALQYDWSLSSLRSDDDGPNNLSGSH